MLFISWRRSLLAAITFFILSAIIWIPGQAYSVTITQTLLNGSSGDEVRSLQLWLVDKGYLDSGSVTGFFGPITEKAVQKFQLDNQIVPLPNAQGYGVVGPKTRAFLNSVTVSQITAVTPSNSFMRDISLGMSGDDVKSLQIYLNNNGYIISDTGPGSPGNETTLFYEKTKAALLRFQLDNKIDGANGVLGPKTRSLLNLKIGSGPSLNKPNVESDSNNSNYVQVEAPQNVEIKNQKGSSITIKWDESQGADSYNISRKSSDESSYKVIASGIKRTTYTDNSVEKDERYLYKVTAVSGSIESDSKTLRAKAASRRGGGNNSEEESAPTPGAPTVEISNPDDGDTVSGASVSIEADATAESSVTSVQFYIDGVAEGLADTSIPYSVTWDTTGVVDGTYEIIASVLDSIGQTASSSVIEVTVDNTSPTISSVSSSVTNSTTLSVTWTTNEPATSQVIYGLTTSYGSTTTLDSSLNTSHTVSITGLSPDYTYNYKVISLDGEGNTSSSTNQTASTTSAFGSGTFFVDTFERTNTTASANPGSVGNSWVDRSGDTYYINNGKLESTGYAWEDTLSREFSGRNWSTGSFYGYHDVDATDSAGELSRFLLGYATSGSTYRAFRVDMSNNSGFSNLTVGALYGASTFFGTSKSFTRYSDHRYRMEYMYDGTTFTGNVLDIADTSNPITLATQTHTLSAGNKATLDWDTIAFANNVPVAQVVLSSTIPTTWSSTSIAYNDSNIFYSPGNWANTGTSRRTVDVGAYAKFKFTGTRLAANISGTTSGDNYIEWQIDDGEVKKHEVPLSMTTIDLARDLSDTTHEVTIWFSDEKNYTANRWAVSNTNSIEITGFKVDSGKTVSAPDLATKRALFYGDSITEAAVPGTGRQSWAAQLSDLIDAEHGQIAFSYQGWTYMLAGTTVPDMEDSWDFHYATSSRLSGGLYAEMPDYIFINQGQNDQTFNNNPTAVEAAAETTVTDMRAAAPSAKIFLVIPFTGAMRSAITEAYNDLQTLSPDSDLHLIDLGIDGPPAYESDDSLHPTVAGGATLADLVFDAIDPIINP